MTSYHAEDSSSNLRPDDFFLFKFLKAILFWDLKRLEKQYKLKNSINKDSFYEKSRYNHWIRTGRQKMVLKQKNILYNKYFPNLSFLIIFAFCNKRFAILTM